MYACCAELVPCALGLLTAFNFFNIIRGHWVKVDIFCKFVFLDSL